MIREQMSRRGVFQLMAGVGGMLTAAPRDLFAAPASRARNVIFMVADGMSTGLPSLAEPFSRLVRGRGTRLIELASDPRTSVGWTDTASLTSLVTDSSAASSAWATGSRVVNAAVNVLPDGTRLTPIGTLARQTRRRFGLVTTTTITHATPAGFAAVHPDRDAEAEIAAQYLDTVDVLLGGGVEFFDPAARQDKRDLLGEFRAAKYHVCDSREGLRHAPPGGRLLGLFAGSHLPYSIDRLQDQEMDQTVPTLAEMTGAALARLENRRGFLLQVEGGRVDHAAHVNDAAGAMHELLAFDDALGVVLDFARRAGDTLVVVTSDHGNSNPGLNGIGEEYADSTHGLELLARATASSGVIQQRLRAGAGSDGRIEPALAADVISAACSIQLSAEDAAIVAAAAPSKGALPQELNKLQANFAGTLAQVLGNHTGIGWTGTSHTADVTMVLTVGPGQERLAGLHANTDVFGVLTGVMGITHRNPSMTPEQARKYIATRETEAAPHWL